MADIENLDALVSIDNPVWTHMVDDLLQMEPSCYEDLNKVLRQLSRRYHIQPSKKELMKTYDALNARDPIRYPYLHALRQMLITRSVRSESGILNISVSLPPDQFSCSHNCFFCPNEKGMPRSYLSNEDVFKRASEVNFDPIRQVRSRLDTLKANGHPLDKVELRLLGGTFSCYPHQVTEEFVQKLYYACNTYSDVDRADRVHIPLSMEEEQEINTHAQIHVVGVGIETRPDEITELELIRFRRYGITRVELGIQHTDDQILKKVNRGHTTADSKRAIRLLKDYGFKVEIHIMTDLPGATPEVDKECYRLVLQDDPDLRPDYLKDYPCLDVSYTVIKTWKQAGYWKPYAERTPDARDLKDVLIYRQQITPKWVRVNRIQRDFIPARNIGDKGYTSTSILPNLGQLVTQEAEAQGIYCQCIRCREIRHEQFNPQDIVFRTETFQASGGQEWFISAEITRQNRHRDLLLGFIRLRIVDEGDRLIPVLRGKTALIRELHVYGRVKRVGDVITTGSGAQHLGLGSKMLGMAEAIALKYGQTRVAIIAGVGVRDYYRRYGYELMGTYMVKSF